MLFSGFDSSLPRLDRLLSAPWFPDLCNRCRWHLTEKVVLKQKWLYCWKFQQGLWGNETQPLLTKADPPQSPPASIVCSRSVFFSVWILYLLFIIFFASNRIAPSLLFRNMEFTFPYIVTMTSLVWSLKEVLKSRKKEKKKKGKKEGRKEGMKEETKVIKNSIKLRQLFWGCSYHISPCRYSKGLYIFSD